MSHFEMKPFDRFNPDELPEPRERDAEENAPGYDVHEKQLFPPRTENFEQWLSDREKEKTKL
jgi:hypothetical protein